LGRIIAESSGVSLRERDGRLMIVDHGCAWVYTFGFVLGLIAFLMLANGIIQVALLATGNEGLLAFGLIATAVGVMLGFALKWVAGIPKKRRAAPAEQLRVVAVLDPTSGMMSDARGVAIAPLSEVAVGYAFNFASSSRSLVARWPGGQIMLARGNAFAGGTGALHDALRARLGPHGPTGS
jgi:hypothetical protein